MSYNQKRQRRLLGPVQAAVLLTIKEIGDEAYAALIQRQLEERSGKSFTLGQIHSALTRMERQKLLSSRSTLPEPVRGGRRKRIYKVEADGTQALEEYAAVTGAVGLS